MTEKDLKIQELTAENRRLRELLGRGRWILRDVVCPESYECSVCKKRFEVEQQGNEDVNTWKRCPCCKTEMEVRG